MQSAELLSKFVDYNPDTGIMVWKERSAEDFECRNPKHGTAWAANNWNKLYAGKEIKSKRDDGYISINIFGKQHRAHRVAWAIYHGEHPDGFLDHINGIRDDNRIENLRLTDACGNSRNVVRENVGSSGVSGVEYSEKHKRWRASIGIGDSKKKHLGSYKTKDEAIAARNAARLVLGYSDRHS